MQGQTPDKIGDMLRKQGDPPGALKAFREGLAIAERRAQSAQACAGWASLPWDSCRVSHNKIGYVLREQGNLPEALKSFREGLAIAERLVQSNPGDDISLYDLWESYNEIGSVLAAQGDLAEALTSFRDGLAAAEQVVQCVGGFVGWQSLPAESYDKIGDVLAAQGRPAEALKAYRDGLAIRERLAQSNPGSAYWQHDLVVSCVKLAEADPPQAGAFLTRASEIVQQMQQKGQLAQGDARLPTDIAERIAALPA